MKLRRIFDDSVSDQSQKAGILLGLLLTFNVGAWIWALLVFHDFPLLLGTAFLAYSFGLRHAVDADHIAAIDNVTRKLMQEGRRPLTAGLMFSLGHSSVVILATLAIVGMAFAFETHFENFRAVGSVVGTAVSALFLLAIAWMNYPILRALYGELRRLRRGEAPGEHAAIAQHVSGPFARLFAPLFRMVSRSWHMYPLGFLFGLTFDTATEIGLLGIAASEAARGLPLWSILVFPILFTAGMSLIDTANGILMQGAFGWAFVKPIRKIYYNFTITLVSVVIALVIGLIEGLGLLADQLQLKGLFWEGLSGLNDNLSNLGFAIIAIFVFAWIAAMGIYKLRGYDVLESDASRAE